MKTYLAALESAAASMQSHRDDQGPYAVISKHEVEAVRSAIAELRAARAVVEAARPEFMERDEYVLRDALLTYDKVVGS